MSRVLNRSKHTQCLLKFMISIFLKHFLSVSHFSPRHHRTRHLMLNALLRFASRWNCTKTKCCFTVKSSDWNLRTEMVDKTITTTFYICGRRLENEFYSNTDLYVSQKWVWVSVRVTGNVSRIGRLVTIVDMCHLRL